MDFQNASTHDVDLVLCIDITGSMSSVIEMVKKNALTMHEDLRKAMRLKDKTIGTLRIRVIAFRDYLEDGEAAMLTSPFLTMPDDVETFNACVSGLTADGGGDVPEDGLEALAAAIQSDWQKTQKKTRQVIVIWTDADAHPLGFGKKSPYYDNDFFPKDFDELSSWWGYAPVNGSLAPGDPGYMRFSSKRLLIYAPGDGSWWSKIARNWDNVVHVESRAGQGLEEHLYSEIVDMIANSIAG